MLNKTYTAISQALVLAFDDAYEVLIDLPDETRNTPYFYITIMNPSQIPMLTNQYQRIQPFEIQYFPKGKSYTRECMEVAEKLFEVLEYIMIDGNLVRGSDLNCKLEEGVLYFYVQFNLVVLKQTEDSFMQEIKAKLGLKEGEKDGN